MVLHPKEDELFVFARHCSGLKLAPSNLLVHAKKPVLIRRSRSIASWSEDYAALKHQWFSGQQKPPGKHKLTEAVRGALNTAANDPSSVRDYSYRPFLQMHALLTPEILSALSKTQGGGTRARPEVLSAFKKEKVIGLAVAPSPKVIGRRTHSLRFFLLGSTRQRLKSERKCARLLQFFPRVQGKGDRLDG